MDPHLVCSNVKPNMHITLSISIVIKFGFSNFLYSRNMLIAFRFQFFSRLDQILMKYTAGKFNQLVYNYPIRIPERFSLVIRSLLTQEGICFTLKPDFKFLEVKTPFFWLVQISSLFDNCMLLIFIRQFF